ncbi:PEX5 [Auxenochlorella protothecoides x Auxenochlorella symbiontica]
MSGLRDLVTGADACGPSDGAGPSNAAASLADALLGRRAKQTAQVQELPGLGAGGAAAPQHMQHYQAPSAAAAAEAALQLPGMQGPRSEALDAFFPQGPAQAGLPDFAEFESIYSGASHPGQGGPLAHMTLQTAVAPFFKAFMDSGKTAMPFHPMRLPAVPLPVADQIRIRDRSLIMARQMFAEQGGQFADAQVGALLSSLNIDPTTLPPSLGQASWDNIYSGAAGPRAGLTDHAANQAMMHGQQPGAWVDDFARLQVADGTQSGGWAGEFSARQGAAQPAAEAWAGEFAGEVPASAWVDDFQSAGVAQREGRSEVEAVEQSRRLADTLAANKDPKFQNSQFLKFISKMSRGEVILEGNKATEVTPAASEWTREFTADAAAPSAAHGPSPWGEEFASFQARAAGTGGDWADAFAEGVAGEWASEFAGPQTEDWQAEYDAELERLHGAQAPSAHGGYVMAENNPFLSDTDSMAKGWDLFKRGVLTEAVLALEAECQRSPNNAEAWRLLGNVQAENDDDQQAIAAMNRALAIDPSNLETLLSLGVSHTNELDSSEALQYLGQWVSRHPTHAPVVAGIQRPADASQSLVHVTSLLEAALAANPRDADLHTALGVVHNLARRYDEAVQAFRRALELRPQDYSLWNKLGATLANSSQSRDAVPAYRKALELKPNYMRAWTNMGISYSNLADYDASARYYVRALSLNPRAAAVWSYLRTALMCGGRTDLLPVAQAEDIQRLSAELPL